MPLFSKSHLYYALLFLLKVLVYLEDLLYEVIWFRWQHSSASILDKLVVSKEDEIWHAVIYGDNGDKQKIFEDLTTYTASSNVSSNRGVTSSSANPEAASSLSKMEAGVLFSRHRTKLQRAIEADVAKTWPIGYEKHESTVKARLESIADQLANSSRILTKKELLPVHGGSTSAVSILWMAIDRHHKSDVSYLLTQRNQKLHIQNGDWQRTVLHRAVSILDVELTLNILEGGSSTSPHAYINAEDGLSRTALHTLVDDWHLVEDAAFVSDSINTDVLDQHLKIFDLLYRHGADINAFDGRFRTPLHHGLATVLHSKIMDIECKSIVPILYKLLEAGAEVNTKDINGNSPLHTACEKQNQTLIEELIRKGADLEILNHDGKSPRRFFLDHHGSEEFWKRMAMLFREIQRSSPELPDTSVKFSQRREQIPKARMTVCEKSVVYCRYQQNNIAAENRNPFQWTAIDRFVSEVLYATNRPENMTFVAQCEKEYQSVWDNLVESTRGSDQDEQKLQQKSKTGEAEDIKRSIPLAKDSWKWVNFSANNITWIRDFIGDNFDIDATTWRFFDDNMKVRNMRSNVSRIREPHAFQDPLDWMVRNPLSKLATLLRKVRKRAESYEDKKAAGSNSGRTEGVSGGKRAGNSIVMQGNRKDRGPKWLMVRQLWLWKLHDGNHFLFSYFVVYTNESILEDTILTAIPSRRNKCMADDLLETIKRSSLNRISDVDDLMKHVVQETIRFPERFRRAGLGEHMLDVFESEMASEADEEATFYNNFAENEWDSKQANRAINCTWRVKDIRDELRLIRNVFTSQLKVVKQFSKVLAPQQAKTSADSEYIRGLVSELENTITRIGVMDSEAAKTTDSLSNITQAMLAQAALKEAEAARFMNFIILPFTIVTVIFTPLSFMTSLFAVNSDGFPHNENGELRIPSGWFWRRMVIDEFGTLIPLLIFILFLYDSRRGQRSHENSFHRPWGSIDRR
ncbi:hypothetical protein FPRO05_13184 [Fusarium proliferatum]|uniref:Uncharacterized protein n=1 Tax=Gibberella intermedia TaxID=948311 RepID=A0A365N300_GIBIN|nr:hypothetical protein FPRO05_13184 [Fusarium proliferatum]